MSRYVYKNTLSNFLEESDDSILGQIVNNSDNNAESIQQLNTWREEIKILDDVLFGLDNGEIAFEYTIPRIGKRVDNILVYKGMIYLLEFKVGEKDYKNYEIDQVVDYALDLKNFHKESYDKRLVPILIATNAKAVDNIVKFSDDLISTPILCNRETLRDTLIKISNDYQFPDIEFNKWFESDYAPTPTIIEAAQYMYRNKSVEEISRNDAGTYNLTETTNIVKNIIENSKNNRKKSICFITGVPGAGKTLAGLNIANETQNFDEDEHAVFLSGNFPLVQVLQEALARDASESLEISKSDALRKTKSYIQIIHHFRDDAVNTTTPPHEKVVIFDEAQRSWNETQLSSFMIRKKGVANFNKSEPEFLIEYMDRHNDWATIICLIGGGQEINTGEAGIEEWFNTLSNKYPDWNIYVSDKIYDHEYTNGKNINDLLNSLNNLNIEEKLHLSVSTRSFRSEKQSDFIKKLLDLNLVEATNDLTELKDKYPIYLTRDLNKAKNWIKSKARGSERYGIVASSGAKRLRKYGIWVDSSIDAAAWFLNTKDDVRSSYVLEQCATEFDIQGLELDWTILGWDADLRYNGNSWEYYSFTGSRWNKIGKEEKIKYLLNSYRVLLTRARQGMIIYVPVGDEKDETSLPEFYNYTYEYLKSIGIEEL